MSGNCCQGPLPETPVWPCGARVCTLERLLFFWMKPSIPSGVSKALQACGRYPCHPLSQHEQKDSLELLGYATFSRTTVPLHAQPPPPGCSGLLRAWRASVPLGLGSRLSPSESFLPPQGRMNLSLLDIHSFMHWLHARHGANC